MTLRAKKSAQFFSVHFFSGTIRVMDVRAEIVDVRFKNLFAVAPVMGRNVLTPGHPGVRVRNVPSKSGTQSLSLCCYSSLRFFELPLIRCSFLPP